MSIRNTAVIIFLSFAIILNSFQPAQAKEKGEEAFSYKKILDDEFIKKTGAVIPLTISKSIETDGSVTNDGKYFFYSSDLEKGNFDIYLRSLTDITTVRITEHASKDNSPAFSPDGKYLAFISQRDDPEGDIFMLELNPEKLIAGAKESGISGLDAKAKNLTTVLDSAGRTEIIKDALPCWSSDGQRIAFSSTRDGSENIWLMDMKGRDLTQITKKGGMYPRFSNDGKKIIYISYRDNKAGGDIYLVNIDNQTETRITNSPGIKLYPGFTGSDDEIIYTLIDRDTNNDGRISLKDTSVIYYKNLNNRVGYRLTLYSESSFQPVWSPVYNGMIIYSGQTGENINVNIIPEYGIIPKKQNARLQFDLAEKYLKEYDDIERYLLCLERTYLFFKGRADADSGIYISRSLNEAGKYYLGLQDKKEAGRIQSMLAGISKDESDYSSITGRYLNELLNGKPGIRIIDEAVSGLRKTSAETADDKSGSMLPFLLEDLGDEYLRIKDQGNAVKTYTEIINEFPDYKRIIYIHYKLANLTYKSLQEYLSPSYMEVLSSNYLYLPIDAAKDIIRIFEAEKNLNRRIAAAKGMLEKYKDRQLLPELLLYVVGKAYLEKGEPASAKSSLLEGLEHSKKRTYIYYKTNILLGQISELEKKYSDFEKYLSEGAMKFERRYKEEEHGNILQKLINYYEEYGERAESTGDYKKAVELYEAYVNLLQYLKTIKIFPEIYNEYAPRAHILYIDAYSEWKGDDYAELSKLEYEFNEKENRLARARISLDKAHIYGLAYIYTKKASITIKNISNKNFIKDELDRILSDFNRAVDQIGWALFMDDSFIDSELLKGWIYQYVDLLRQQEKDSEGKNGGLFSKYFPDRLWERNISSYEKALAINNERDYPEREGNLHLNLANTYFLLSNYPRAFAHYKEARKYKKNFNSKIEEALFYYHLGYCYWQNDELAKAKEEMKKTMSIYEMLSSGNYRKYKYQIYYLYRFFALFDRMEKKYDKAIASFTRIIEFSNKYNIKIDMPRCLQEIAYCYKELGEPEAALLFLDKAGNLLTKYKITERDYSLKISILGLLRFSLWDLGEESFIIGDSRIYTELDTTQKRILNASLEEEILFESGDFQNSIEASKRKLAILKDSKDAMHRETRIKALNNIGLSYCKLQDYNKAKDYFEQAISLASDTNINNLEGLFISVVNAVNLYSFMLENGAGEIKDPVKTIDSFIKRIADFKESYREKRYREEIKKLKESAKARSKEISAVDITAVEHKVLEEAGEKYNKLDTAISELEFQKAELLRQELLHGSLASKNAPEKAYEVFTENNNIYNLYFTVIERYEKAVERAEKNKSKRLLIRLLLNLGKCQERVGQLSDSYNIYLSVIKYASAYGYEDLLWIAYQRTADFLVEYGNYIHAVEEENYFSEAQKYYNSAADIIEEYPYLYKAESYRIKSLYNNYSNLLVNLKSHEKALEISERGYEVLRIIFTGLSSPKFHSEPDNDIYKEFIKHLKGIEKIKGDITALLEAGESNDATGLAALKENMKSKSTAFKNFIADMKKRKPLLASYISLSQGVLPKIDNAIVYKFIDSAKGFYAWKIEPGNVFFKEILYNDQSTSISESINSFMQDPYTDKLQFVVMNDASIRIFQNSAQYSGIEFPLFMFVPSVERVRYYTSANNITVEKFSIVINDKAGYSVFFQKRMEPGLLIIKPERYDLDSIMQITEASLYSGVKTLYVCNDKILPQDITELIAEASLESFDMTARKNKNILGIGFKGYIREEREKIKYDFKNREYGSFQKSLENSDIESAELHLNKWHEIDPVEDDNVKYFLNMAEIEYLRGNYLISLSYIDKAVASANNSPEIYVKAVSNKIFLLLHIGDLPAAELMMQENTLYKNFNLSADYLIYKAILALIRSETVPPVDEYKKIISGNSILPGNKLKLLFAEYLNLFGSDLMNSVLEDWDNDYVAEERDILKAVILNKNPGGKAVLTRRAEEMISVSSYSGSMEVLKNNILLQIAGEGKADNISIYPLYFAANNFIKNFRPDIAADVLSQADIVNIAENAQWLDAIPFFAMAAGIFEAEERYEDALNMIKAINDLLKSNGISSLLKTFKYKEALLLSKLEKNNESYNSALNGITLVKDNEELYIQYQLQLVNEGLYLGKIEDAKSRIALIERNRDAAKNNKYVVDLLKARIELLNILKNKQASEAEWGTTEGLIISALKTLDGSPEEVPVSDNLDLINQSIDFLISYKMSRNDAEGSLLYAEIKKQINIRLKYHKLITSFSKQVPEEILRRFKNIKDKNGREFADLLNTYPVLQINAFPSIIPFEIFQQKLEDNTAALYIVANAKDILGWVISKTSIKTIRLKDGYERANEIIRKYYDNLSALKNTTGISKELYSLFKPFEKYYKEKNNLIIITDKALESIPFEIIGEKDMLEEAYDIVYLSSILSSFITYNNSENFVRFIDRSRKELIHELEFVAVRESGIPFGYSAKTGAGIAHLNSEILFDSFNTLIYVNNKLYYNILDGSGTVYIPYYKMHNLGLNEFTSINSLIGAKEVIINNAWIHDLNNAFFIDILYTRRNNKDGLVSAFHRAKESLRKNKQYSYPAYWAGIRLYLNGI